MLAQFLEPALILSVIAILIAVTVFGGIEVFRFDRWKSRIKSIVAAKQNPVQQPSTKHRIRRRSPRRDTFERSQPDYETYLRSSAWKSLKQSVLARDQHTCQRCGSSGPLHVHHLTYERRGREQESDLTTLCYDCHKFVHENGMLGVSEQYRYRQSGQFGKEPDHSE